MDKEEQKLIDGRPCTCLTDRPYPHVRQILIVEIKEKHKK